MQQIASVLLGSIGVGNLTSGPTAGPELNAGGAPAGALVCCRARKDAAAPASKPKELLRKNFRRDFAIIKLNRIVEGFNGKRVHGVWPEPRRNLVAVG